MFNYQSMFFNNIHFNSTFVDNHLPLKKRAFRFEPFKDIKSEFSPNYLFSLSASSSPRCSETCSIDSGFCENEPLDLSFNPSSPVHNDQFSSNSHKMDHSTPKIKLPSSLSSTNCISTTKLTCPNCNKIYESNARFRAHIRRHESKQSGRYQCKICLKNFVQRSSLRTHERIHTGEKPYQCLVCNERFGDFSTFTKHRRTHTGEKPYSCPVCSRCFSQSGNMHRHLKVVHRSNS